ncbi:MAG: PAS domain-containing protein [Alphaproteobacteria bacterium]|nr:PAS domain-containing protein [Alphaproteobacteria bacterium]
MNSVLFASDHDAGGGNHSQIFRATTSDGERVRHYERSIADVRDYPDLESVYTAWRLRREAGDSTELDVFEIPPALLPTVMLIELSPSGDDAVIRLAGTYCCELYGGELRGKTVNDFFQQRDARDVLKALNACAQGGEPSLADRRYVCLEGDEWGYTRLLLPQPPKDGRLRVFKAMDRSSLYHLGAIR